MNASAPPLPWPRQPLHSSLSLQLSDDAQHRLAELAALLAGFTASTIAEASCQRLAAGMKLDSWKKAVRLALAELARAPSVLHALDGDRFERPVPPAETKH